MSTRYSVNLQLQH